MQMPPQCRLVGNMTTSKNAPNRSVRSFLNQHSLGLLLASAGLGCVVGCNGAESPASPGEVSGRSATGGVSTVGGTNGMGGSSTSNASGGSSAGGSASTGGVSSSGGTTASSGGSATGGASGVARGGNVATGGNVAIGGNVATGGNVPSAGRTTGGAATAGGSPTGGKAGSGGAATAGSSASATGGSVAGSGPGTVVKSTGCGKTPTLKNSPTSTANQNTLTVGGKGRQFLVRWPDSYDNAHPYRLIIGLHGATGKDTDIGPSYFGLFALSNNSTIFIAPSADGGLWSAATDTTFVDEILKAVQADLCIDTTRILLEGFSQGAAMSWTLACSRPGVFRAVVGHSGGGVANPTTCQPIPYLGSLGLAEGNGQNTQTDQFAKWNGCTITTLPRAPTGGHVCTNYTGCPAADPVRWCSYDGGHTPSPNDTGQSASWMPKEVWAFFAQF